MLRPLSAGAALASCHYAVADVSGGYFNPAVTVSVMANGRNKLQWFHGGCYIAVQVVCAAFACVMFEGMYPKPLPIMVREEQRAKIDGVAQAYTYTEATAVGLVFSFVVCYVVLATETVVGISTQLKRNSYNGLAYGFASAAGGFVLIHLSNALANPALMLGEGLTTSFVKWQNGATFSAAVRDFLKTCVFTVSYFFGAVLASIIFRITHAAEFDEHADEEAPLVDSAVDKELSSAATVQSINFVSASSLTNRPSCQ